MRPPVLLPATLRPAAFALATRIAIAASLALALAGCVRSTRHASLSSLQPAKAPKTQSATSVTNATQAPSGDLQLETLRQRVIDDPADTVARLQLAAFYDHAGMKELALEHYRLIGVRRPEDEHAHLRYARHIRPANPAEARRELHAFLAQYPARLPDTQSLLAILEDESGDLATGETHHRQALALAPQAAHLHNNLGYNLAQQGRHADAVKSFRRALQLNARSEVARNNLAASLAQSTGRTGEAFHVWKRSSGPAQAHNNLGAIYLSQGRHADARREFEEALKLSPALPEAWRNLARVAELDGQPAQLSLSPQGWRTLAGALPQSTGTPPTAEPAHNRPLDEKINKLRKAEE